MCVDGDGRRLYISGTSVIVSPGKPTPGILKHVLIRPTNTGTSNQTPEIQKWEVLIMETTHRR